MSFAYQKSVFLAVIPSLSFPFTRYSPPTKLNQSAKTASPGSQHWDTKNNMRLAKIL